MLEDRDQLRRNAFERLAEKRVTQAVKQIRLIGNLANKHNYSYSAEQVRQLLDALDYEMRTLRERFKDADRKREGYEFRFKGRKKSIDRGSR